MYSIQVIRKKLCLFLPVVLVIALLVSCGVEENSLVDFKETDLKYLVSLSRSREKLSKLLFYDNDGNLYKELNYKGSSINSLNQSDNKLLMYSNRTNEHYSFDSSVGFHKFSLTSKKSDISNAPTWFVVADEDCLIETINFGRQKGSAYLSSVIYDYNGEKKEILLEWEYLNNAISVGDKIFIESYNELVKKNGLVVVNKENEEFSKVYFENGFTSKSGRFVLFNEKIVTYGNSNESISGNKMAAIGSVNIKSLETKEKLFKGENILFAHKIDDTLKVITDQKKIYVFNSDLDIVEIENMTNHEFVDYYIDGSVVVRKILDKNDVICVLYTSKNFDKKNVGFIVEYDKSNYDVIKKVNIQLKNEKDWMGEVVDFIIIE